MTAGVTRPASQPQRTVVVADHHVIAVMPQTITGTPTSRATIACQRKRLSSRGGFLLAFAALQIVLIASAPPAGFLHAALILHEDALPITGACTFRQVNPAPG
ncbi:hypothetical protein MJ563_06825 [Klebsiella pneumoniae]|nr:hypothetical protein MJ563_06825 [Klebsiella pneumoniae]